MRGSVDVLELDEQPAAGGLGAATISDGAAAYGKGAEDEQGTGAARAAKRRSRDPQAVQH